MKQTVFVGLSGGVDSSVSAYLLKEQGYNVVGVFIKVWQPDFLPCHWERERLDAMRVAAHLEIPFLTCNAEQEYKRDVADYFIEEYKRGRTPNPDVMCNTKIKFGAFYEFAKKHKADAIATGHYARTERVGDNVMLLRGADTEKDQSYFLWNVPLSTLANVHFPVGALVKDEVRKIAARTKLPTAQKNESQGICFLGHVDVREFLEHFYPPLKGAVLDTAGHVIGEHHGALLYTIGQRHGFSVMTEGQQSTPVYVTGKNMDLNTITVSPQKPVANVSGLRLALSPHTLQDIRVGTACEAQTRYRQTPTEAQVVDETGERIHVALTKGAELAALGQSCVLFDGPRVLGGGIIDAVVT